MTQLASDLKMLTKYKETHNRNTIGFIPTMGALHEGHLSLIRKSQSENDTTIVSIYVNPTQFGPKEDFNTYPRQLEKDSEILRQEKVNCIFTPTTETLYPEGVSEATMIDIPSLSQQYCGKSRPQFFRGVCSVVYRLFTLVNPQNAYFGEKDYQQLILIKKMVKDLKLPVTIHGCPIIRTTQGLALSSRNQHLTSEHQKTASAIYGSLMHAKTAFQNGITKATSLVETIKKTLPSSFIIDYIAIVDPETLQQQDTCSPKNRVLIAGTFINVRLIDNIAL